MPTSTILITVDAAAAQAFATASAEDKRKLQILLDLRLRELTLEPRKPLKQIMEETGAEAAARGLTPEILESLLNEP